VRRRVEERGRGERRGHDMEGRGEEKEADVVLIL
jgi:hypothetical protein